MNESPPVGCSAFMRTGRTALCIALMSIAGSIWAKDLAEVVSLKERHCALRDAPADAGVAATPGGFVLIFPRNQALASNYTGCKVLWLVDGDQIRRLATLYFKDGTLRTAAAHDSKRDDFRITNACRFPEGRAVIATPDQKSPDAGCNGILAEPMYSLRTPTWPRTCLSRPDDAVCSQDPQ